MNEESTINRLDHVAHLLKCSNGLPWVLGKIPVSPYGIQSWPNSLQISHQPLPMDLHALVMWASLGFLELVCLCLLTSPLEHSPLRSSHSWFHLIIQISVQMSQPQGGLP